MKKLLLIPLIMLASCAGTLTPQQQAIATTATNLARVAASAAATYYGGPQAGELAAAGLDSLGAVLQAYVGNKIPADIVTGAPGVNGVGQAVVSLVAPNHVVSQADADKAFQAAQIASQLAKVVVVPSPESAP